MKNEVINRKLHCVLNSLYRSTDTPDGAVDLVFRGHLPDGKAEGPHGVFLRYAHGAQDT